MLPSSILLACAALAQAPARNSPDDWPRWRGAHGDDTAHTQGVFARPFELAVRWRHPIGSGYSGVSVAGGLAVTLAASEGSDVVVALDAKSGEERWRHALGPAFVGQDGAMDGPCSTPTIDGDSVYALAPRGELVALTLSDGKQRWSVDLVATQGAVRPHWGFTVAPLCVGELVIVAGGAPDGRAFQAFSTRDGALRWSTGTDTVHYQSPILATVGGEELVIGAGNLFLFGIEPKSGALRWRLPHEGRDFYQEVVQPTALGEDRLLLKNQRLASRCVRVVSDGENTTLEDCWSTRALNQNYNTAVLHDGLLFGHAGAFLACVDAESGDAVWRSREPGDGRLLLVDDQLVVLTKDGGLYVARAGPDGYEERAALALFEHLTWTPPSFAQSCIYARDSFGELACVGIVPRAESTSGATAAADAPELGNWFPELRRTVMAAADPEAEVERFLAAHPEFPLVEDGRIAHFLYHGPALAVALQGDVVPDLQRLPLARLGATDWFHAAVVLEPDARIAYQFVRDIDPSTDEVLLDPRNPRQAPSLTLVGRVSELLMPEAVAPPPLDPEPPLESFTLDVPVTTNDGRAFGGPRPIQIALPPGYADAAKSAKRYPVLYVNDAQGSRDPLGVPGVLAELARRGRPVIGVFVERQGAYELARAEQELYRDLLARVLVPYVDAHYRTQPRPEARIVFGWDEGAYAALFAALSRPDVFGAVGVQSLYHGSSQGQSVLEELVRRAPKLPAVYLDWGSHDGRDPRTAADTARSSRALAQALESRGATSWAVEAHDGDHAAFWRARLPAMLEALVPGGP